jgi:uncharacterized protein
MRTVAVEEHYAPRAFMEGPGRDLKAQAEAARDHPQVAAGYAKLIEQLRDLDDGRVAAMDAAGVDVQILSLTSPGVEQLDAPEAVAFARETNDLLAEAVRRHPGRFSRVCRVADRGTGSRRRRAGAHGPRSRLQGGADKRPHQGTLS